MTASDYGRRLCRLAADSGLASVAVASADYLPFSAGSFDLVTVFMAFHDFDELVLRTAFGEIERVLSPDGVAVVAVNHPVNSFLVRVPDGQDQTSAAGAAPRLSQFEVKHSYFGVFAYENEIERDGLAVKFRGVQRSVSAYVNGFLDAGLQLESMVEVTVPANSSAPGGGADSGGSPGSAERDSGPPRYATDWSVIPMFLDMRFRKTGR